jgi:hypothetical protein
MAAQTGLLSAANSNQEGVCEHHFPSCHSGATKILDMDALDFWKFLTSMFNFRIGD